MYVVVWELKHGRGGHQLALNMPKAEQIRWRLSRERPDAMIRVEPAENYAAAAVQERSHQRQRPG